MYSNFRNMVLLWVIKRVSVIYHIAWIIHPDCSCSWNNYQAPRIYSEMLFSWLRQDFSSVLNDLILHSRNPLNQVFHLPHHSHIIAMICMSLRMNIIVSQVSRIMMSRFSLERVALYSMDSDCWKAPPSFFTSLRYMHLILYHIVIFGLQFCSFHPWTLHNVHESIHNDLRELMLLSIMYTSSNDPTFCSGLPGLYNFPCMEVFMQSWEYFSQSFMQSLFLQEFQACRTLREYPAFHRLFHFPYDYFL